MRDERISELIVILRLGVSSLFYGLEKILRDEEDILGFVEESMDLNQELVLESLCINVSLKGKDRG